MASVVKNTAFLTSSLVFQKLLSLVYFRFLAQYLGPTSLGQYSFVLSFTTIFGILVDLGFTSALTKEVSKDPEHAEARLRAAVLVKFFLGLLAYGSALTVAVLLGYGPGVLKLIALSGVVMVFDGFHLIFYGVLRGLRNLLPESIGMIAAQLTTVVAGALGMWLKFPLSYFVIILAIGSFLNVVWSIRALLKSGVNPIGSTHRAAMKSMMILAIPFAVAGIFSRIYSYLDSVMLQYLKGDTAVGYYSVAYKITYAFQFVPLALSAALYPALASYWVTDKDRFQSAAVRSISYCAMLGLPLTLLLGMLAPELINTFFDARYMPSILLLQVSVAGLLFAFLYFPLGSLMNATKYQGTNTIILGLTTILNAIMNWLLIPRFEGLGSSIAQVASNGFLVIASVIVISQTMALPRSLWVRIGKICIAGAVMSCVLLLKYVMPWPVAAALASSIFVVVLVTLKTFHAEDVALASAFLTRIWPRLKNTLE